eukprot:GEMP01003485.1.p1 GENE.GEMP01003485.1~~GEMP01003485.1.p1  ORF type:complete len:1283 (+),score=387.79 GEMP01003485.1:124-3972(+)
MSHGEMSVVADRDAPQPVASYPIFSAPQRASEPPSNSTSSSSTSSFHGGGPPQTMNNISNRASAHALPPGNVPLHALSTPAAPITTQHVTTTTGQRAPRVDDAFVVPHRSSGTVAAHTITAPTPSTSSTLLSPTLGYGECPHTNALTWTDRAPAASVARNNGVRENAKAFALSYPNQLGRPTTYAPLRAPDITGVTPNIVAPFRPNKVDENVRRDETNNFKERVHVAAAATTPLSSQFQAAAADFMAPRHDTSKKDVPGACTLHTLLLRPMVAQLPCPKGPSEHALHSLRSRSNSPDTPQHGITCPPPLVASIASSTARPPHVVSARAATAPLPGGPGNFGSAVAALLRAPHAEVLLPNGRSRTPSPQLSPKLHRVKPDVGLPGWNNVGSSSMRSMAQAESGGQVETIGMRSQPPLLPTEPTVQALVPTPGCYRPCAVDGLAPSPGGPLRSMSPQPHPSAKSMSTVGPPSMPSATPLVHGDAKPPPTFPYQPSDAMYHIRHPTSPGHQYHAQLAIPRQQPPVPPWTAVAEAPTYAPLRYPRYDRPVEWKEALAMVDNSLHVHNCIHAETSFMNDGWSPDGLEMLLRKKHDELVATFLTEKNNKEERRAAKRVKQAIRKHRKLLCKLGTDFAVRKQSLLESAKWMETQRQNMLQVIGQKKEEFAGRSSAIATLEQEKQRVCADIDTYKAFSAEVASGQTAVMLDLLQGERSNLLAEIDCERRFVDISIDANEVSQSVSKQDIKVLAHTMDESTKNAMRLYHKTLRDVEDFDGEDVDLTSREAELRAVEEKERGLLDEAMTRKQAQAETLADKEREAQELAAVSIKEYRAAQNARIGQYRQQKADESIRRQHELAKHAEQDESQQRAMIELELTHAEEELTIALEEEERRRRRLHEDELDELVLVQEQMEDAARRAQRGKLAQMEASIKEDMQASHARREELESAVSGTVRSEGRERHSVAQKALRDAFDEDKAELEKRMALELATVREAGERNDLLVGELEQEVDAMAQRNTKQEINFAALLSIDAELRSLQKAFEVNVGEDRVQLTSMLDNQVQLEMELDLKVQECLAETRQLQTDAAEMAESLRGATVENQVMVDNLRRKGDATADNTERFRQALAALEATKDEGRYLENAWVQDDLTLKTEITSEKEMAASSERLLVEYKEKMDEFNEQQERLKNDEATMQALSDKELDLTSEMQALREEETRERERVARIRAQEGEIEHETVSLDDNRIAGARAEYAKLMAELEALKKKVEQANSLAAKYEANQDMNELMKQQAGGFED